MLNIFKLSRIAIAVAMALLLLFGCKPNESIAPVEEEPTTPPVTVTPAPPPTPTPTLAPMPTARPTVEPTATPVPSRPKLPQMDSSTARIPITTAIYELFTNTHGYVGPKPMCSKTHGAWLNLADGVADIIFLVAPTRDELDYFTQKGVDIEMKVYGFDGLVFIGNTANSVKNLTSEQIRGIYSGVITSWAQLGGDDVAIDVYIRNPESGSQRLFESLVWDGYDMPEFGSMRFTEGESYEIVDEIWGDMGAVTYEVMMNEYSIAFNISSYIDSEFSDAPALKLFSIDGYAPYTSNFTSGDYPYCTTSYVAIRANEPEDSPARQLYDWLGVWGNGSRRLLEDNSTLSVEFSDSVVIRVGKSDPTQNKLLRGMISRLNTNAITRKDLFQFTLEEIGYLHNGVYAHSGKIFSTPEYSEFFGEMGWYNGKYTSDVEAAEEFNDIQKKNLRVISYYENELKRAMGVK